MVKNPQKQKQKTIFPFLKQKQDIISEKQKPRTKMVTLENQIIIHNPNKQFFFSLQQYHYFLEQKKIQKQWKEERKFHHWWPLFLHSPTASFHSLKKNPSYSLSGSSLLYLCCIYAESWGRDGGGVPRGPHGLPVGLDGQDGLLKWKMPLVILLFYFLKIFIS